MNPSTPTQLASTLCDPVELTPYRERLWCNTCQVRNYVDQPGRGDGFRRVRTGALLFRRRGMRTPD